MTPAPTPNNDNQLKDALERATAPNGEQEGEIAADDAGASTLAEKIARNSEERHIEKDEKAGLAEEASRQSDA
ncbi:hypothetical protein [Caulobacter sp. NIBR2454]|uniref:hypothetical protein n=1 Tax=Caulobacter sp. NIBR2454 TaxID=3015996 RepID=UPI0022B6CC19|nr:hypothetical protein [Caulobacter sp. NIBR2454]